MLTLLPSLLSFIVIIVLLYIGFHIERHWVLSRFYVSLPLVSGLIGFMILYIVSLVFSVEWVPEPWTGRMLVTSFLFFVGFNIGRLYTRRYLKLLVIFLSFSTLLLVVYDVGSWFLLQRHTLLLEALGASSFAWNEEWLRYTVLWFPEALVVDYTSLILVFLVSPWVLRFMAGGRIEQSIDSEGTAIRNWHPAGVGMVVIATISAVWLKQVLLGNVLFLFDFVISMGVGAGIGLLYRGKETARNRVIVVTIAEVGKLSLYGFIIFTMLTASQAIVKQGSLGLTALLVVKLLLFSCIMIFLSRRLVRNRKHLVWASAIWAYTLSAPVTCMNAMRTVVNKHGEADEVILIVPPVILWLINYPHFFIFNWLYST